MTKTAIVPDDEGAELAALRAEVAALRAELRLLRESLPLTQIHHHYPPPVPLPQKKTDWQIRCGPDPGAADHGFGTYIVNDPASGVTHWPVHPATAANACAGGYQGQTYTVAGL